MPRIMKQELSGGPVASLNSELLGPDRRVAESCDRDTALRIFMRWMPTAPFYSSSDIMRQAAVGERSLNSAHPINAWTCNEGKRQNQIT